MQSLPELVLKELGWSRANTPDNKYYGWAPPKGFKNGKAFYSTEKEVTEAITGVKHIPGSLAITCTQKVMQECGKFLRENQWKIEGNNQRPMIDAVHPPRIFRWILPPGSKFPDGQEGVDFWASFPRLILSVIETFKEGKCENPYITYDVAGRLFDSVIWPAVVLKLVEEKWEFQENEDIWDTFSASSECVIIPPGSSYPKGKEGVDYWKDKHSFVETLLKALECVGHFSTAIPAIRGDEEWDVLWFKLRCVEGWSWNMNKLSAPEDRSILYLPPGGRVKGEEGEDYFATKDTVKEYVLEHLGKKSLDTPKQGIPINCHGKELLNLLYREHGWCKVEYQADGETVEAFLPPGGDIRGKENVDYFRDLKELEKWVVFRMPTAECSSSEKSMERGRDARGRGRKGRDESRNEASLGLGKLPGTSVTGKASEKMEGKAKRKNSGANTSLDSASQDEGGSQMREENGDVSAYYLTSPTSISLRAKKNRRSSLVEHTDVDSSQADSTQKKDNRGRPRSVGRVVRVEKAASEKKQKSGGRGRPKSLDSAARLGADKNEQRRSIGRPKSVDRGKSKGKKRASDERGSQTDDHRAEKKKRTSVKKQAGMDEMDDVIEFEMESAVHYSEPFPQLWKKLQKMFKWTWVHASKNAFYARKYLPPWGDKNGKENEDFFTSEAEVVKYVRTHSGEFQAAKEEQIGNETMTSETGDISFDCDLEAPLKAALEHSKKALGGGEKGFEYLKAFLVKQKKWQTKAKTTLWGNYIYYPPDANGKGVLDVDYFVSYDPLAAFVKQKYLENGAQLNDGEFVESPATIRLKHRRLMSVIKKADQMGDPDNLEILWEVLSRDYGWTHKDTAHAKYQFAYYPPQKEGEKPKAGKDCYYTYEDLKAAVQSRYLKGLVREQQNMGNKGGNSRGQKKKVEKEHDEMVDTSMESCQDNVPMEVDKDEEPQRLGLKDLEDFSSLCEKLESWYGWKWATKRGSKCFLPPDGSKDGERKVDYFLEEDDDAIVDYAYENYFEKEFEGTLSQEYERVQQHRVEGSPEQQPRVYEEWEIIGDECFRELFLKLKKYYGWKYKAGTGLTSWVYCPPYEQTGMQDPQKNGTQDVDYFVNEAIMMDYVFKNVQSLVRMDKEGKGGRKVTKAMEETVLADVSLTEDPPFVHEESPISSGEEGSDSDVHLNKSASGPSAGASASKFSPIMHSARSSLSISASVGQEETKNGAPSTERRGRGRGRPRNSPIFGSPSGVAGTVPSSSRVTQDQERRDSLTFKTPGTTCLNAGGSSSQSDQVDAKRLRDLLGTTPSKQNKAALQLLNNKGYEMDAPDGQGTASSCIRLVSSSGPMQIQGDFRSEKDLVDWALRKGLITEDEVIGALDGWKAVLANLNTALSAAHPKDEEMALEYYVDCRQSECEELRAAMEGYIRNSKGGAIFVTGMPGTGKTMSVKRIVNHVKDWVVSELGGARPKDVYLTSTTLKAQSFYAGLWEGFSPSKKEFQKMVNDTVTYEDQAKSNFESMISLGKRPSRHGSTCKKKDEEKLKSSDFLANFTILVLDEIDMATNVEKMKELVETAYSPDHSLLLIGIANKTQFPESLKPRHMGASESPPQVVFSPYSETELRSIMEKYYGSIIQEGALNFLARKVAARKGDARQALDYCQMAVEKLIKDLESKVQEGTDPTPGELSKVSAVTIPQMNSILKLENGAADLPVLPLNHRQLLYVAMTLQEQEDASFPLSILKDKFLPKYYKFSASSNLNFPFRSVLDTLSDQGFISITGRADHEMVKVLPYDGLKKSIPQVDRDRLHMFLT